MYVKNYYLFHYVYQEIFRTLKKNGQELMTSYCQIMILRNLVYVFICLIDFILFASIKMMYSN